MQSYFVKTSFNMIEVKFYITSINHLKPCNFFSIKIPLLFLLLCFIYSVYHTHLYISPLDIIR